MSDVVGSFVWATITTVLGRSLLRLRKADARPAQDDTDGRASPLTHRVVDSAAMSARWIELQKLRSM